MTAPTLFPAARKLKESEIELTIRRLFTSAGLVVYKASQGYRKERGGTRMSPGIPDLWWFSPALQCGGWFEVKTPDGLRDHAKLLKLQPDQVAPSRKADHRRAIAQAAFRNRCVECGVRYGFGGIDEARAFLVELGLAELRAGVFTLTPMRKRVVASTPAMVATMEPASDMLSKYEEAERQYTLGARALRLTVTPKSASPITFQDPTR